MRERERERACEGFKPAVIVAYSLGEQIYSDSLGDYTLYTYTFAFIIPLVFEFQNVNESNNSRNIDAQRLIARVAILEYYWNFRILLSLRGFYMYKGQSCTKRSSNLQQTSPVSTAILSYDEHTFTTLLAAGYLRTIIEVIDLVLKDTWGRGKPTPLRMELAPI